MRNAKGTQQVGRLSLAVISRTIALALLLLCSVGSAAVVSADEAILQLDEFSMIQESHGRGGADYVFPAGAHLRLFFGRARDGVVPVTVPLDGLKLGTADAAKRPSIIFGLAVPARGLLTRNAAGLGLLELDAAVLVHNTDSGRVTRYDLRLTTELALGNPGKPDVQGQALDTASGQMQLVTPGQIRTNGRASPLGFQAVISGRLDHVPVAVQRFIVGASEEPAAQP